MEKKISGWNYFNLGLTAFAGLGLEVILAFLIEPLLYHAPMQDWNTAQSILHWCITCILWGAVAAFLISTAKNKYSFSLLEPGKSLGARRILAAILCVALAIFLSYLDWDGFKVVKEYIHNGPLLFSFQYLYYAFETALFTLIIIFAQKAFETWFQKENFPFGGIVCGLTWGLGHLFTKGSLLIGLQGLFLGFLMGSVYLLVNRDIKKAYLLLFLMFAF